MYTHWKQQRRNRRLLLVVHQRKEWRQVAFVGASRKKSSGRENNAVDAAKTAERHKNRNQPGDGTKHAIAKWLHMQFYVFVFYRVIVSKRDVWLAKEQITTATATDASISLRDTTAK